MRRLPLALIFLTVTCWLWLASDVRAADHGTIQISTQGVGQGSVTCSGSYTLDQGWAAISITLKATPTGGGSISEKSATYANLTWNSTTIMGLTSGVQYNVWAEMKIQDQRGNNQTISSVITHLTPQ